MRPKNTLENIKEKEKVSLHGRHMVLVAYYDARNVDVSFDDGLVVATTYDRFKKGDVCHPEDKRGPFKGYRVGESIVNRLGETVTITAYRSYNDIDVIIDDKVEKSHCRYLDFSSGNINSKTSKTSFKDCLNKKFTNKYGETATVIEYVNANKVTIQFDTGEIKNCVYSSLVNGTFTKTTKPNLTPTGRPKGYPSHLGETVTKRNGETITIIEYNGCRDFKVQFSDGTITQGKLYSDFLRGAIKNPNKKKIVS